MAIDVMQKVLDDEDTPENLKCPTLYAVVRLCAASGAYPQCLVLEGIHCREDQPVTSGRFGEIWKGYFGDHPVSLKVARLDQRDKIEHIIKSFRKEAIIWNQLTHPNLLPFYGIYHLGDFYDRVCLVSPWMENGNISDYLKAHPQVPRLPLVYEILAGLSHLHEQKIVHGDLKSANILISTVGSACLADFGLSSVVDAEILRWTSLETLTRLGGTIRWEAPELMDVQDDGNDPKPTFSSDIYSSASVMYEVLTGQVPFHEFPRPATVIYKIIEGITPTRPSTNLDALELSDGIWEVMQRCWSLSARERPTADEITEALRSIPPPELTMKRIARKCDQWQEASLPLTPQAFRTAIRGVPLSFSADEIKLLKEYVNVS